MFELSNWRLCSKELPVDDGRPRKKIRTYYVTVGRATGERETWEVSFDFWTKLWYDAEGCEPLREDEDCKFIAWAELDDIAPYVGEA